MQIIVDIYIFNNTVKDYNSSTYRTIGILPKNRKKYNETGLLENVFKHTLSSFVNNSKFKIEVELKLIYYQ